MIKKARKTLSIHEPSKLLHQPLPNGIANDYHTDYYYFCCLEDILKCLVQRRYWTWPTYFQQSLFNFEFVAIFCVDVLPLFEKNEEGAGMVSSPFAACHKSFYHLREPCLIRLVLIDPPLLCLAVLVRHLDNTILVIFSFAARRGLV